MCQTVTQLNEEWRRFARTPAACAAMSGWRRTDPVLGQYRSIDDLVRGHDQMSSEVIQRALARLAETDDAAARTLLQCLMPGLVRLVVRFGDRPDAAGDVFGFAWMRIRTYPVTRPGSVSANVVLDVMKSMMAGLHAGQFEQPDPDPTSGGTAVLATESSEECALRSIERAAIVDRVGAVARTMDPLDLELVVGSRSKGRGHLVTVASESGSVYQTLVSRRWRAQHRLRTELADLVA